MYVIGLTGGVGSGKTQAAKILSRIAGAKLLVADEMGHQVMRAGSAGCQRITERFGKEILAEDGSVDRGKLSAIVFGERRLLDELNAMIHPLVKGEIEAYLLRHRQEKGVVVLETAIMFETGCDALCDEVWMVYAPEEVRIGRLKKKRGYTEEKCRQIIAQQYREEEYRKRCNRVVSNDGDMVLLEENLKCAFAELHSMEP